MKSCNNLAAAACNQASLAALQHGGLSQAGIPSDGQMNKKLNETDAPAKGDYAIGDPALFARNMMEVGQQSQRCSPIS